jgi:hypothetical protein
MSMSGGMDGLRWSSIFLIILTTTNIGKKIDCWMTIHWLIDFSKRLSVRQFSNPLNLLRCTAMLCDSAMLCNAALRIIRRREWQRWTVCGEWRRWTVCGRWWNFIFSRRLTKWTFLATHSMFTHICSAYLGGDISAKIYSTGATGNFIKEAAELFCDGLSKCQWRNVGDDALDWATGTGTANPDRLLLVTGTTETPGKATTCSPTWKFSSTEPSFLVLASNPRDGTDQGLLVSDPIGCQLNEGEISFRHWLSLADQEDGPDLEVCRRFTADKVLRDCQPITLNAPAPGPTTVFIPRSDQPFEASPCDSFATIR